MTRSFRSLSPEKLHIYALFARAVYILTQKEEQDRILRLKKIALCFGYTFPHQNRSADVMITVKKVYSLKYAIISHRGTDLNGTRKYDDIINDLCIGGGLMDFQSRLDATLELLEEHNPDVLDMTGHSLGGTTVMWCIANSKVLRNKLRFAALFNEGNVPLCDFNRQSTSQGLLGNTTDEERHILDGQVVHYRHSLDPVSVGLVKEPLPFGRTVQIDQTISESIAKEFMIDNGSKILKQLLPGNGSFLIDFLLFGRASKNLKHHTIDQEAWIPRAIDEKQRNCLTMSLRKLKKKRYRERLKYEKKQRS